MKKVYIVGIGPGEKKFRTEEAHSALTQAQVLCGYPLYLELISEYHTGKTLLSSQMTQEVARCRLALEEANKNQVVAMVCSGDASIYGMASLLFQLSPQFPEVELEVVAGITAALSGGSLLGAPLSGDFVVISLSDLLTPWETIEKRLEAIGFGDFPAVIYNPSSKKRSSYLERACDILLRHKPKDTICGICKKIGREGQESQILPLHQLKSETLDMFSTVFIGNSQTVEISGKMVTLRGYENKYQLDSAEN